MPVWSTQSVFQCHFHFTFPSPLAGTCRTAPVGISNRSSIPDHRMTATSFYDNRYKPSQGRLTVSICAWEAKTSFTGNDYLQVDLGGVFFICALATKGNGCGAKEWTETYKIYLSSDGKSWNPYTTDSGVDKVSARGDRHGKRSQSPFQEHHRRRSAGVIVYRFSQWDHSRFLGRRLPSPGLGLVVGLGLD